MSYIEIIVHAVFWLLGFFIIWRIPACKKSSKDPGISSVVENISIIIPARNEEKNLPRLLTSLSIQTKKPLEIIVIDDDSTDSTAEIAKNHNARVIRLKELPPGWIGKTWACHNGAYKAKGKYYLFLDADTFLEKDGLEKIAGCVKGNKGVVSIQPYHKIKKLYENLSLYFNLILIAGMGAFTILGKAVRPIGAFGPCLLCSAKDYDRIGGHESIKGKVMEDIAIGKEFLKEGINLNCMGGKGVIDFRMYPGGFMDVVTGWTKSFSTGARSTSIPVLIMVIAWIGGSIFPIILLVEGLGSMDIMLLALAGVFYVAFASQIYWMSFRIGSFNPLASIIYFMPMVFFIIIFLYSFILTFIRRKVTWKDRYIKT
jgi:4,4'-diaponeurosporenoate glycosyltransferase